MKTAGKNSKALAEGLDADEYAEKVAKNLEYLVKVRNCRKIRYYGLTNERFSVKSVDKWSNEGK